MLFVVIVVVTLLIDQVSKMIAIETLADRPSIELIPGFLSLTLVFNPGAAFGLGSSMTVVLTIIALVVCVVVARIARKLRDGVWAVALALLLSGALGNLIDRIFRAPAPFRGHVVDFLNYNGWFVGNLADVALTVAAAMMIIRTWQGIAVDGTRETEQPKKA
ncbi:hypothetical protein GCM10027298_20330 [Epidermidibacterium keratini]